MSYLLEQTDQYYEEMVTEESEKSSTCGEASPKQTIKRQLQEHHQEEVWRVGGNPVGRWESAGTVRWCVAVGEGGDGVLQVVQCERGAGQWSSWMVLTEGSSTLLRLHNRQRMILLQKELLKRTSHYHLLRLSVNPHSGHLTLALSSLFFTADPRRNQILQHVLRQTKWACDNLKDFIGYVRQLCQHSTHPPTSAHPYCPEQVDKLRTLMRRYGTYLAFAGSEQVENDLAQSLSKQRQSKTALVRNQVPIGEKQARTLNLFLQGDEATRIIGQQQLQFKFLQKEQIRFKIKMPGLTKCRNVFENNAILNYIKINNPHLIRHNLKPANQGGFSKIYSLDIEYWYVYSGSNNQVIAHTQEQRFSRENMLRKLMVVKRDLPNAKVVRQRVAHEKEILKKIKNGNALFLPKYYIATDECEVKDDLLADFIFQPSMVDYVFMGRLSLSLNSKIYMLFMLTQALRYLSLYSIVHLDIKPANLMISRTMLIKVIDFGESYHPDVCQPDHAPGFTMPYSSPESYYPNGHFDQKNDVFSFGVIAYELLYGHYPFFLSNPATRSQVYRHCDYPNHWFYNPEELLNYGDQHVFPLVQLLIARCLHPTPSLRPDLHWLCVTLRQCLDYYYF